MSTAERARAALNAGDYHGASAAALEGLAGTPDDVELLALAGRAGVELGRDDAVEQLERATQLAPDDGDAWHHLGEAYATEGRMSEAGDAFRRAVELNPDDAVALTHLGHTSYAAGNDQEAVGLLAQAAESTRGASTAAISLVDMYRTLGEFGEALVQARRIVEADPSDLTALLDVAELSLATGELDDARDAFTKLRERDDSYEAYPLYGVILVELTADRLEQARALAGESAPLDPEGSTLTEVQAFLDAELSGPGEEPAPTRERVTETLQGALARYRRLRAEDRRLGGDDLLG
ncbi:MAG TPA: tetratricopeptide repeat protein [Solirubrobacteraceae bacterium]|jgi:Flp pilus assembly protein TadD|nr:tetratricopeptide repeat protein [Solirubrobacteraceae bacterium]